MPLDGVEFDYAKAAKFFDHLVDLVPAKYYLDTGEEQVNLRFLKRSVRDEARAAFKQQGKLNKRAKLDPDTAKTTLQLQKELAARQQAASGQPSQQGAEGGAAESDGEPDGGSAGHQGEGQHGPKLDGGGAAGNAARATQLHMAKGKPPSREELRERLQKKLEVLRQQRKADEKTAQVQAAREWRDQALAHSRKQAQQAKRQQKPQERAAAAAGQADKQRQQQQQGRKKRGSEGEGEAAATLAFSRIEFGAGGEGRQKKKQKLSKQELLQQAMEKKARLAGLEGGEGKEAGDREAWGSALLRAQGNKVLDNAKLLKRSIKKEAKLKAKKAQAWQERLSKQQEQQASKQQKRHDNIQGRIEKKKDKRKERRENKLLRAGFEGRKEGFIATTAGPAAAAAKK